MRIVLESIGGNKRTDVERAKEEIIRVLGFRGNVIRAKAERSKAIVEFEINTKWDLPAEERIEYLKDWMPAKVKSVFRVVELSF